MELKSSTTNSLALLSWIPKLLSTMEHLSFHTLSRILKTLHFTSLRLSLFTSSSQPPNSTMPTAGKSRSRRSPGTSYSSTITTIIFVALCVLGVWLLSSDTFASPQPTSRKSKDTPTQVSSASHISEPDSKPDEGRISEPDSKPEEERAVPEDIPGELPEDVVKPEHVEVQEIQKDESSDSGESSNDSKNDVTQEIEEKKDVPKSDESSLIEENPDRLQGKESLEEKEKQAALETQPTEESSVTQKQEVKELKQDIHAENKQKVEKATESTLVDSSDTTENQISDEDQQKRLEQHQKQEDDQIQQGKKEAQSKQDPNGATSQEQVMHDEEPVNSDKESPTDKKAANNTNDETTGIPKESKESKKSWSTQVDQSEDQKERRKAGSNNKEDSSTTNYGYEWKLCNETAGQDFIPCLDNEKGIAKIRHRNHYEHRERHCPEEPPTCLVPLPKGYKKPIEWPQSRDKIWYHNVPHTLLAEVKGHQNWVKVTGEFLTFPGGGTQFIHGALHYIDFIQQAAPDIAWGKHTRVILDVGCGVASLGGYLFERDVLAMSFAPKDEHEAQVQFALERGIPAISAVMGTQRLPFPSRVFDIVHCARCRVPWHADGGALLLELNRVLRPGGYFVWSATPVYQKLEEDVQIWQEMSKLTVAMCWELVTIKKDKLNSIGVAVYHKPDSNDCYEQRKKNQPPMCKTDDDPNAAWYVPLQSCMHKAPVEENERGSQWPEEWPKRVQTPPYWLSKSQMGIYGKPAPDDFAADYKHWKEVVTKSYMSGLGINWSNVRNIMDMRAVYGGFAAALKDLKVWVMNVVNVDGPDTLPIIYERGLIGIYHDWCESFSTYPRTYDLLHADHLFSKLKKRCKLVAVVAEVDRIVRPGGKLIVRDESGTVGEVENLLKSLHWEVHMTSIKNQEGILSAQKTEWRPEIYAAKS